MHTFEYVDMKKRQSEREMLFNDLKIIRGVDLLQYVGPNSSLKNQQYERI